MDAFKEDRFEFVALHHIKYDSRCTKINSFFTVGVIL